MSQKYVYLFKEGSADGDASKKDLLGGKGANLAEMGRMGLPVPPGFTITTEVCIEYLKGERRLPEGLREQVAEAVAGLEEEMGARFGDPASPLLLSARSGSKVSMPGMMNTVLNIGLNDATVMGLAERSGDRRFAMDCHRRLIQMYGSVVLEVEDKLFHGAMDDLKEKAGAKADTDLSADQMAELVGIFRQIVREASGRPFPEDPQEQLWGAIEAVFRSWDTPRAVTYRRLHHLSDDMGTAVNVQAMVFGNLGDDCATGVAFTRDPATGENRFYGEYLANAQGEDVVAGIRTPRPLGKDEDSDLPSLEQTMPELHAELVQIRNDLETHYRDMQDLEFTIQQGKLFILQTRTGKRTSFAAVRMAMEMIEEGMIDRDEAIRRVDAGELVQLLSPVFDDHQKRQAVEEGRLLATALNAGPGAATGKVVFDAETAQEWAGRGEAVVLARTETSPEDVGGMHAARGILTSKGGMTSHAAVVARGMGKPCVCGAESIRIDYGKKTLSAAGKTLSEGDWISIDGTTGEVLEGRIDTRPSDVVKALLEGDEEASRSLLFQHFSRLLGWADEERRLGVRANADTPHDAGVARKFGAQGIGLCRTEHMFFGEDRINIFRRMILAHGEEGRREALDKLLPIQREDFRGILEAMDGLPVTIRLLDPPLHEFLPHDREAQAQIAREMGIEPQEVQDAVVRLSESNPMLGHRGCRLGISYPDIYQMQARAIFEAARSLKDEGRDPMPEIMVPLVGFREELAFVAEKIEETAREVFGDGPRVDYLVGTMIEIPRAALTAGEIAKEAQFFSFGTNDLTQMGLGFSRDDASVFLPDYLDKKILLRNPFESLDRTGIGQLVEMGTKNGRRARPDLKVGICGEHGGEPSSVHFFHGAGLDYVSCSPYRLPVARLAAAQAALEERTGAKTGSGTE